VGDVGLIELPLGDLRGHVALVTQEHHVFIGTLRENLILARPHTSDDEVHAALEAVDAQEWVASLPVGLDTIIGSGRRAVTVAHAQQIALAGWCWPTRTRWSWTRRRLSSALVRLVTSSGRSPP
jgi:ABC-type multidrug transport system fused ATPase/permease subunit